MAKAKKESTKGKKRGGGDRHDPKVPTAEQTGAIVAGLVMKAEAAGISRKQVFSAAEKAIELREEKAKAREERAAKRAEKAAAE